MGEFAAAASEALAQAEFALGERNDDEGAICLGGVEADLERALA
jgi:hypothetical protein